MLLGPSALQMKPWLRCTYGNRRGIRTPSLPIWSEDPMDLSTTRAEIRRLGGRILLATDDRVLGIPNAVTGLGIVLGNDAPTRDTPP